MYPIETFLRGLLAFWGNLLLVPFFLFMNPRKIIALIYMFGSIIIPNGLFWLAYILAPAEFVLNNHALPNNQAVLNTSRIVFPNAEAKETFSFPGALMGLTGKMDDHRFWLLICKNQREAGSVFRNYAKSVTDGSEMRQVSGPRYHQYTYPKTGISGRIKWIDRVVLHVQGKEEGKMDYLFNASGILTPNPKANLLTEIFHGGRFFNKYIWVILLGILIYAGIQLPIWNGVTAWATTVKPDPGVIPVEEAELRKRLLAINDQDVPFHLFLRKNGQIEITWRLADAKWSGLMTANKVSEVRIIRLKLSDKDKVCRALDIVKSVKATTDGLTLTFSFGTFFSRGAILWERSYEKHMGWIFKDGHFTFDIAYEYDFRYDELRTPIVHIVLQSGWRYQQVLFY